MIEVGDRVRCINAKPSKDWTECPALVEGREYIVYGVKHCCKTGIDVGFFSKQGIKCYKCGTDYSDAGGIFWFSSNRFRKIEPEYRAVSVPESITEQAKTLLTPETVAQ